MEDFAGHSHVRFVTTLHCTVVLTGMPMLRTKVMTLPHPSHSVRWMHLKAHGPKGIAQLLECTGGLGGRLESPQPSMRFEQRFQFHLKDKLKE